MKYYIFFITLIFSITLTASFNILHASTSGVSGGNVKPGNVIVFRSSYTNDNDSASQDNRVRSRVHYEHGFNDSYALRLILTQNKNDNDRLKHNSFRIENRFQFFEEDQDGFHGTLRIGYNKNRSDSDDIRVRLNGSKKFYDTWQYRQNIIFGHEIGANSDSGISVEGRFAVQKEVDDYNIGIKDIGIDLFTNIGNLKTVSGYSDQRHTFGPYIKGDVSDAISYEIGYRQGISNAAGDNSIRLFLGYGF